MANPVTNDPLVVGTEQCIASGACERAANWLMTQGPVVAQEFVTTVQVTGQYVPAIADWAVHLAQPGNVAAGQSIADKGGGQTADSGGSGPNDPNRLRDLFAEKFSGKPGAETVLKELGMGGTRAQGASWQARYALQNLNPDDVMGFEQPGTTGRVDVILRQGSRLTFLENKGINWYALEQKQLEGQTAQRIVEQVLGHAEGQNVFSKVVIEATGNTPAWFVNLLEQEGIKVEVFSK